MKSLDSTSFHAVSLNTISDSLQEFLEEKFLITKNYELLDPNTEKNLLDTRCFNLGALLAFFNELYLEGSKFIFTDTEVDAYLFKNRLFILNYFFEKTIRHQLEEAENLLLGIKDILHSLSGIETSFVKIEFDTLRVFVDQGLLLSKHLKTPHTKAALSRFCCHREIEKADLLTITHHLKSKFI